MSPYRRNGFQGITVITMESLIWSIHRRFGLAKRFYLALSKGNSTCQTYSFHFQHKKKSQACRQQVSPQTTYLFWSLSESQSFLLLKCISAHCVYSDNYSWYLCIQGACSDESASPVSFLKVQSVRLNHGSIRLPIPCSHFYVTSDEKSCSSLSETLHGILAL